MPSLGRRRFFKSSLFLAMLFGGIVAGILAFLGYRVDAGGDLMSKRVEGEKIKLPSPRLKGNVSLEEAIYHRRSRREYLEKPLRIEDISQLLWSAQGITEPKLWVGLRSAPSAGGLYPLELYVAVKEKGVDGLKAGVYHYDPYSHTITLKVEGDISKPLMASCVDQEWVGRAPINLIFTAIFERTSIKYGKRALQYVYQESGHAAQNVYLQAEVLGLGGTVIGAFIESEIQNLLSLPSNEIPVYVMPIGAIK
ncbi:MAG: SagB/ThcOx family dehydrogenase [Nitrososphaerales archaeon]